MDSQLVGFLLLQDWTTRWIVVSLLGSWCWWMQLRIHYGKFSKFAWSSLSQLAKWPIIPWRSAASEIGMDWNQSTFLIQAYITFHVFSASFNCTLLPVFLQVAFSVRLQDEMCNLLSKDNLLPVCVARRTAQTKGSPGWDRKRMRCDSVCHDRLLSLHSAHCWFSSTILFPVILLMAELFDSLGWVAIATATVSALSMWNKDVGCF